MPVPPRDAGPTSRAHEQIVALSIRVEGMEVDMQLLSAAVAKITEQQGALSTATQVLANTTGTQGSRMDALERANQTMVEQRFALNQANEVAHAELRERLASLRAEMSSQIGTAVAAALKEAQNAQITSLKEARGVEQRADARVFTLLYVLLGAIGLLALAFITALVNHAFK